MKTNKFRLFSNSNVYKSSFTFASLISILVLSLVILFSIKSIPSSISDLYFLFYKVSLLFLVWYGGNIVNRNLHISKHGDIISYFMVLFFNASLATLVYFRWNYIPTNFEEFNEIYYFTSGMLGFAIIWLSILYIVEKKTRLFFSKYLFWKVIADISIIIIFMVGKWNFDKYFIRGENYYYLENSNLMIILFMPIVLLIFGFASIKGYSRISKYANEEKTVSREIAIWNSFIRIASMATWVISSIGINISSFNFYDKIYGAITLFCLTISLLTSVMSFIKKYNRFLVYVITTNLIIMSINGFIFVNILNSTPSNTFIMFIMFIVLFQSIFIFIKPSLYKFYPQLNSLLTYLIMIFILLIWFGYKIVGEINFLNINEIIWGILVFISILMFLLYVFAEFYILIRINRHFGKIIKLRKVLAKREKRLKKKRLKKERLRGVFNG